MIISKITATIMPDVLTELRGFYSLAVRVTYNDYEEIGIQKVYPIDPLKSMFDMIWEDIGKELKKKLMEDENDRSE